MRHAPVALLALALLAVPAAAEEAPSRRRVLFLTQSVGYVHEVVRREEPQAPSLAERALVEACADRYDVVCSQDAGILVREDLAGYAAVVLYTTGELPEGEAGHRALFDYVRAGGGLVGIHPATDTWYAHPDYHALLGGTFDGHPWHQAVRVRVEEREHPATAHLGEAFEIVDEIYQFKDFDRRGVRVLLSLDPASVDLDAEGVKREDGDFALAWCKPVGDGRVLYTALGHRPEVWRDARFLRHVVGAIGWAAAGARRGLARDEAGFVPLFDEPYRDGWRQAGPGRFVVDVEGGTATTTGGMGLYHYAPDTWRNFLLAVEFRQKTQASNAGVFVRFPHVSGDPWPAVREGYEIQIGGADPSKTTTGAIYSFQAPRETPLRPAGSWNAYEIACTGQRYAVRLNGRLVTEYVGDRSLVGGIGLQNHGHPDDVVDFRAVRIKPLPDEATAYHVLFEGSKDGWAMCGPGAFEVEGEALRTEGGMGMLWHERSFGDFVLLLDWKVERPQDNAGVFVRFPDPGDDPWVAVHEGYEIQICDLAPAKHRTGSIYSFEDAREVPTHDVGTWNHLEVRVVGQRYEVLVNGVAVTTFTGDRSLEGHVGLQNHDAASKVRFRDVRVVELGGR